MKNFLTVVIILVLLGVGGYFYLKSKGMVPKAPIAMTGTSSAGSVFTSIKDALSKSLSLKCTYKDEKGVETTTYLKNGAIRVVMTNTETNQPNNVIMKDKKMYMWDDATKAGFVYAVTTPENVSPVPTEAISGTAQPEKSTGDQQQESLLTQINKFKNACKPDVIADSMFAVPTDVKFQDMNALQNEMIKNLPKVPQGTSGQNYQDYINQMKQQGAGQ
ncbi:hypothetical protein M1328_05055 [Patescibacteria group bacterium]|nr:hypothetical protein [Patescibacteria group bacterium]